MDIAWGVTSSYIESIMYIFSSTTNQIRRRLYPQENRLAWLFIRVPLCKAIDVCLIRESTSRIIPANWQWCMMANRNGIGAVETVWKVGTGFLLGWGPGNQVRRSLVGGTYYSDMHLPVACLFFWGREGGCSITSGTQLYIHIQISYPTTVCLCDYFC